MRTGPVWLHTGLRRFVPGPVAAADRSLFRLAASSPTGRLDAALRALSTAANHGVLWMSVAAGLAATGRRAGRRAGLRGILALSLASAVANIPVKLATGRTRPDIGLVPEARRLARLPRSTSFPSGHSASAAAFATGVAIEAPKAAVPVGLLAAAVAYSRVHTGVHYPLDVLAGVTIGAGAALATRRWWPAASPQPAASGTPSQGPAAPCPAGWGLAVVVNAQAGEGTRAVDDVLAVLPEADVRLVEDPERLEAELGRAARDATVLGVAGGDGSVNAAAAAALDAGVPLAVLPLGTLNRFASELGVETLQEAADAITAGRTLQVDVAEIDGRLFVDIASFGGYPELVAARERLEGRIGKWPAVAVGVLRVLRTGSPVHVDIDGRPRRVWLGFIGNCRYEPGGFAPSRRSRLDDGILDVRLVDAGVRWARARLLVALATGSLARSRVYQEHRLRRVLLRSRQGPLPLTRDGELFEGGPDILVEKRAVPLAVVAPERSLTGGSLLA